MKRIAAILLLIFGIAVSISAQSGRQERPRVAPQSSPTPDQKTDTAPKPDKAPATTQPVAVGDDEVLRVETNLVSIPVSVFDRNGRYLANLKQEDFKIFEDGKEQEVSYFGASEQPVTVVLVFDTSPSTQFKIEQIQNAGISFINQLKPNDKVMVIEFDANIHVLSDFTSDKYRLAKAIRKADFGSGTALYDTVENVIYKRLKKEEGRKAVVLFTDGVDTESYKADAYSSLRAAEESAAPFYVVYYNTYDESKDTDVVGLTRENEDIVGVTAREYAEGKRYLTELTEKSGGRIYSTENNSSLEAAFSGIAEELRRQYNVGYYPTEVGKIGQRKQLKVRVNRPDAIVKARENYIVGENNSQQSQPAAATKNEKRKN